MADIPEDEQGALSWVAVAVAAGIGALIGTAGVLARFLRRR